MSCQQKNSTFLLFLKPFKYVTCIYTLTQVVNHWILSTAMFRFVWIEKRRRRKRREESWKRNKTLYCAIIKRTMWPMPGAVCQSSIRLDNSCHLTQWRFVYKHITLISLRNPNYRHKKQRVLLQIYLSKKRHFDGTFQTSEFYLKNIWNYNKLNWICVSMWQCHGTFLYLLLISE